MHGSGKYKSCRLLTPTCEMLISMGLLSSVLANVFWCAKINKDKSDGKYAKFQDSGDDRDPMFRMIL